MGKSNKKNNKFTQAEKSDFIKDAQYRVSNFKWLTYSGKITLRMMAAMEDNDDLKQIDIAGATGMKPQQISKILKGKENLTLKTIATLSDALGIELISFPEYKYSRNTIKVNVEKVVTQSIANEQFNPYIDVQKMKPRAHIVNDTLYNEEYGNAA